MTDPSPTLPPIPSTIANLPAVGSITNSDFIPLSQAGVTYRATASQIAAIVASNAIVAGNGIAVATASNITTVALAALPSADILVGNGSNVATAVAVSGDVSLSNTGAITLATVNPNVGSFTNANITVNGKGLITAASSSGAPIMTALGVGSIILGAYSGANKSAGQTVAASALTSVTMTISNGTGGFTSLTLIYQGAPDSLTGTWQALQSAVPIQSGVVTLWQRTV